MGDVTRRDSAEERQEGLERKDYKHSMTSNGCILERGCYALTTDESHIMEGDNHVP